MGDLPVRVLLIDDREDDYRVVRQRLDHASSDRFELDWARGYDEGLARLSEGRHDACLLDDRLAGARSFELMREALRAGNSAPFILLTGSDAPGASLDALLAGSTDLLSRQQLETPLLEQAIRHAVDRARHLTELRRSEERFRALVENLSDAIVLAARDGLVLYASRSVTGMLQWPVAELVGRPLFEWIHPEDLPLALRLFSEALARPGTAVDFTVRGRTREGAWRHLEGVGVNRLGEPAVRAIVLNFRDVSQRKDSERHLRERERQFRAVFDNALDATVLLDDARALIDTNPAAGELFRLPADALLGRTLDEFLPDRVELPGLWTDFIERGELTGEFTLTVGDGSRRDVELSARAHTLPGRHLMVLRDVTEQRQLEAQLHHATKMEAVGRLAGGIAHDFNNLLTAILGSAEFLAMELPVSSPHLEDVEEIRRAAARAASLTQQLLAFSRRQVLHPKVLDLNAVVEGVRRMLGRLIGEDIALETRLQPGLGRVRADPGQMEQVLLNLAVNARDAMPGGGRLIIETLEEDPPESWDDAPLHCVALHVSDSGVGMDERTRTRLFEPFFTTKDPGKGTGLGLSTVYGVVQQSGGFIELDSAPGQGSTFRIYLPRVEDEADGGMGPSPGAGAGGSETILLVEDEESVRRLARRILNGLGYRVLVADNAQEALRLLGQRSGPLDLLLTDVVMPGMSGPELAELVAAEQPGLKVIFMSGYTTESMEQHGVLESGRAFLQKPFTPQALSYLLRQVLTAGGIAPIQE